MRRVCQWSAIVLVVVHVVLGAVPWAAERGPRGLLASEKGAGRIDPIFGFMQAVVEAFGPEAAVFRPTVTAGLAAAERLEINTAGAGALLRFERPLTDAEQAALTKDGVLFYPSRSGVVRPLALADPPESGDRTSTNRSSASRTGASRTGASRTSASRTPEGRHAIYRAWVSWEALEHLASHPLLVRAEATWRPDTHSPIEVTAERIGARAAQRRPLGGVDGAGVLVGNIDSGIAVLHPAFFHADGGLYAWIDVNGNGRFDPGVDAVDLNGNGRADANETLRVLDGAWVRDFTGSPVQNRDGALQASLDWVYADMNGDGERNAGRAAGFSEADAAYGEPLFVVDDVNGNDRLDPGEKLVRLGSSKIRKYVDHTRSYERGVDLIDAAEAPGLENAFHGTGVTGILVGGQPGYHQRVGIAPAADVIVYGFSFTGDWEGHIQSAFLEDAIELGVDVLLHEWTNSISRALDGSSNLEAVMDYAREGGMVQVNPMGNLNLSRKHAERTGAAGETVAFEMSVGPGFHVGGELLPYATIFGSIQWRAEPGSAGGAGDDDLPEFELASPSGQRVRVERNGQTQRLGAALVHLTHEQTLRGTHIANFWIWGDGEGQAVEPGEWTLAIGPLARETTFYGRVSDYHSGWAPGVTWTRSTADVTTLSFPATADSAVGVAAYGGRHALEEDTPTAPGQVRRYSGRGPRIDGRIKAALAAPDDPFAPIAPTPRLVEWGWGTSWYATFGGTSGAGPHVAGAFALLRQRHPDWTAVQLEQRLFETAGRDDLGLAPDAFPTPAWGWGRLDVYRALYDARPPSGRSPRALLSVQVGKQHVVFDARSSVDPDGEPLEYRYDFDYDGVWDVDWTDEPLVRVARGFYEGGDAGSAGGDGGEGSAPFTGRLEVRNRAGIRSGALASFMTRAEGPRDIGLDFDAGGDTIERPAPIQEPESSCFCGAARAPAPGPAAPLLGLVLVGFVRRRRR